MRFSNFHFFHLSRSKVTFFLSKAVDLIGLIIRRCQEKVEHVERVFDWRWNFEPDWRELNPKTVFELICFSGDRLFECKVVVSGVDAPPAEMKSTGINQTWTCKRNWKVSFSTYDCSPYVDKEPSLLHDAVLIHVFQCYIFMHLPNRGTVRKLEGRESGKVWGGHIDSYNPQRL